MAVYFANKIGAPGTGNYTPTTLAWSRHAADRKGPANGSPLVAVAFESGVIGVYTGACTRQLSSVSFLPPKHISNHVYFFGRRGERVPLVI